MSLMSRLLLVIALVLAPATAFAEPLFTLADDGSAFIYKARPGDQPGSVAAMFGIGQQEMPAFFAANGITDPTRVGIGHVYRIPNPLAVRAAAAEARAHANDGELASLHQRVTALESELGTAREAADTAERKNASLARLEHWWPIVMTIAALLVVAAGAVGAFAFGVIRKSEATERYARSLAADLEEKRRAALAERQQSARQVLDLEARIHDLEVELSQQSAGFRRSPAGAG